MKRTAHTGAVCYVGHDHEGADGRMLEGGWHYTAVVDEAAKQAAIAAARANVEMWETRRKQRLLGPLARRMLLEATEELAVVEEATFEIPGEKLWLDPDTGRYSLAGAGDESWHARHHGRLVVVAVDGDVGLPRTDEEFEATHRHLDELEKRLHEEGLHPQEHGHLNTTKQEIQLLRQRLKRARP